MYDRMRKIYIDVKLTPMFTIINVTPTYLLS